jgi:hypothetical protein
MAKLIIVGSGILGLSVAEYLTREKFQGIEIKIITNDHKFSGSKAAAANLATKGQLFARDSHFELKLHGKKIYKNWIHNLLKEDNCTLPIDTIFKNGEGIDYFTSSNNRDKHYLRVKQDDSLLNKRNLPTNTILKIEENKIKYIDESWVDAQKLLNILKNILIKRGVLFEENDFYEKKYHEIIKDKKIEHLIFCTGAWTKNLLENLNIPLPLQITKQERLTFGSTFFGDNIIHNINNNFILSEKISNDLKSKVTFSGIINKTYISSSSLRIKSINELNLKEINLKNNIILELAKNNIGDSPNLSEINDLTQLNGFRVGYGHTEIVLDKLNISEPKLKAFVCTGAHKSGYLFAPVIGHIVQNLLFK